MLKQIVKSILCPVVVALMFLTVNSPVFAQLPPPISPWMGMLDRTRSPGSISSYHQNVKPQQDMMRAYAAQANQLQSQQQALQALQSGGGSSGGAGTNARDLASAGGAPGGGNLLLAAPREIPSMQRTPAGFQQYLHYYPTGSMPRKPVPNYSTPGRRR